MVLVEESLSDSTRIKSYTHIYIYEAVGGSDGTLALLRVAILDAAAT